MDAMERLQRRRRLALAGMAASWLILAAVLWVGPDRIAAGWPVWLQWAAGLTLLVVVANAALFCPILALMVQGEIAALRRLLRGEGVVARWVVTQAAWAAFLDADARLAAQPGGLPNLLDRAMPCPPEGIACLAGHEAVLVGRELYHLFSVGMVARVSWRDVGPGLMEVQLTSARGGSAPGLRNSLLRLPVPAQGGVAARLHAAWLHRAGLIGNAGAVGRVLVWRNRALAGLALGLLLCAVPMVSVGFVGALEGQQAPLLSMLLIPGILLIAFGLGFALRFHMDSRHQARSDRGEGVIGAWRLDQAAWRDFVAFDTLRREREDTPWNLLRPERLEGKGAVQVTVGEDSVRIGDQFFHIPSFASAGLLAVSWLDRRPACIEIRGRYQARVGAFSRLAAPSGDIGEFTLRFPVAAEAEPVARRALATWRLGFPRR